MTDLKEGPLFLLGTDQKSEVFETSFRWEGIWAHPLQSALPLALGIQVRHEAVYSLYISVGAPGALLPIRPLPLRRALAAEHERLCCHAVLCGR